eukprot:CAMPEP_0117423582 /NCGR_PEP_ID=MMETSP0758-20121206/4161_1 /TAXON_ID=63605 /ORGANISM="Percolomonas cosmopolitus, Strain AE-1 (ATCC 50343)" /LENGTH=910 /DNA_ID=CAMNT_0005206825 /DNA_START=207 /DNA_END=2939 /DNA_ORIENTATION=-
MVTKLIEQFIKIKGKQFLSEPIKTVIDEAANFGPKGCEIDPSRIDTEDGLNDDESKKKKEEIAQSNFENLKNITDGLLKEKFFTEEFIDSIPREIRGILRVTRNLSEEIGLNGSVMTGAIIFLRILNPTLLNHKKIKLECDEDNVKKSQRTRVLIAKIAQNLSNQIKFGEKEQFMVRCNGILTDEMFEQCNAFLEKCCLPQQELDDYQKTFAKDNYALIVSESITNSDELCQRAEKVHRLFMKYKHKLAIKFEEGAARSSFWSLIYSLPPLFPEEPVATNQRASRRMPKRASSVQTDVVIDESKAKKIQDQQEKYEALLKRAKNEDLSEIEKLNPLTFGGEDAAGRPIVILTTVPMTSDLSEKMVFYIIRSLDKVVDQDYSLIVCIDNETANAGIKNSFAKMIYSSISRKYKKNLKTLYLVHAGWLIRTVITVFKTFISPKFWSKFKQIKDIRDMYEVLGGDPYEQSPLPLPIIRYNHSHDKKNQAASLYFGKDLSQIMSKYNKARIKRLKDSILKEKVLQHEKSGEKGPAPTMADVKEPKAHPVLPFISQIVTMIDAKYLNYEGIYRKSGRASVITELEKLLDAGYAIDFRKTKVHDLVGVLKVFIKKMEPTLFGIHHDDWVNLGKSYGDDIPVERFRSQLEELPQSHRDLARLLFLHWHEVTKYEESNKMNANNIAVCIQLNVLSGNDRMKSVPYLGYYGLVVTQLIEKAPLVFKNEIELPEEDEEQVDQGNQEVDAEEDAEENVEEDAEEDSEKNDTEVKEEAEQQMEVSEKEEKQGATEEENDKEQVATEEAEEENAEEEQVDQDNQENDDEEKAEEDEKDNTQIKETSVEEGEDQNKEEDKVDAEEDAEENVEEDAEEESEKNDTEAEEEAEQQVEVSESEEKQGATEEEVDSEKKEAEVKEEEA